MLLPVHAEFSGGLLKALGALAATLMTQDLNSDWKNGRMIWSRPNMAATAQWSCPIITYMPRPPVIACVSFHSPSCLLWYPRADLKRGRRWKAVKTRLLWSRNFMNLCQKSPSSRLNFWNVIKRFFSCLFFPPPFLAAPDRWQMWRSLVMWAFSCWAGKMEASTHFLENPKNSSSSQLVPITAMKEKREGNKKGALANMKRPEQLPKTGPS